MGEIVNKTNSKKNNKWYWNWASKNFYLAFVVMAVVVYLIFLLLDVITRNGKEFEVPSFTGLTLEEAQTLAKKNDLRVEVTDSVYMFRIPLGVVYKQNPIEQSKVKKNRRILLTINSTTPKLVKMPNLVGYSLRQAQSELSSNQLKVGKLIYKTDIATNNVLGQIYNGYTIPEGKEIPTESEINLVVGMNPDNDKTFVPNIIGKPFSVVKDFLIDNSLNLAKAVYDNTVTSYSDSMNAIVYKQEPMYSTEAGVMLGTPIKVFLTLDVKKKPAKINKKDGE